MINKIVFDKGAVFDYEGIVCRIPFEIGTIRTKVEKLIDEQKYTLAGEDLRIPYYDDRSERLLLLFVKKGYRFGPMQTFIVQGICDFDDYDEEMENNGVIADWLGVEID